MIMKKYSWILVGVLLVLFFVQAALNVWYKAPIHDEPNWMIVAWYITHHWTWQGDYHVLMHPPLSFYIQGIPLRLLELWYRDPSKPPPEGELAERFPYPYSETFKYDTVFTIAKLSVLPLALLLGWYVYRWATQLYGMYAGLFALSLYAFNPYMLAYSTIITSDMTAACFIFVTAYHFWKYCTQPSKYNMILLGIPLGLALLSKATAALLFPIFGILVMSVLFSRKRYPASPFFRKSSDKGTLRSVSQLSLHTPAIWLLGLGIAICIALFILEMGYLFDIQPVRTFHSQQSSDLIYRVFKDTPIPFGAYINGIRLQQSLFFWVTGRHFFAGQYATSSWWYYHLATFLLKNPIPLTIFLLLTVFYWKGRRNNLFVLRENFLVVPALFILFYFSFIFPHTLSSRFVLAMYPLLFVFISRIVTFDVLKKTSARIVFGVLVGWYILSTAAAFPHYLAYCNELIGGTENGYKWFASTSFDSGQDLKALGRYIQKHHIPFVKLAYHGKAVPEFYGVRYIPWVEPEGCHPTNGLIAISTTRLQGVNEENHNCYDWLKQYEPIDKIGYTFFIYNIP